MKFRNLILSLVICVASIFGLVSLGGCSEVSLSVVSESFDKLETTYQQYSNIFKNGVSDGVTTSYIINYGTKVDSYISANKDGYVELKDLYNSVLIISNDYIDNNKEYVKKLNESKLSDSSKKALTKLNSSLVVYTKEISKFVNSREIFVNFFQSSSNNLTDKENSAYLRKFKKAYGALVEKNLELAKCLTKVIETTDIFTLLQSTEPTQNDTKIVKEYLRSKILPIFSEFMISELENKINWNSQQQTSTKDRIDDVLSTLKLEFSTYKTNLVSSSKTERKLDSKEEMNDLFSKIEDFFTEADVYYQALKKLNISSLATSYANDLEEYKKVNNFAEIYLERIEQFINVSLPSFLDEILLIIY